MKRNEPAAAVSNVAHIEKRRDPAATTTASVSAAASTASPASASAASSAAVSAANAANVAHIQKRRDPKSNELFRRKGSKRLDPNENWIQSV